MSFNIKVTDCLNTVMFTANISNIYLSTFMDKVKPHSISISKVETGLGNCGEHLEYMRVYDGVHINYSEFVKIMNKIDI